MKREAAPQDSAVDRTANLSLHLAEAVDWRLDRVQETLEQLEAPDPATGRDILDRVTDSCDRARRRAARADLDAEVVSILIDRGNLSEARELASGRLAEHVEQAKRHAAQAESDAGRLREDLAAANRTIEQAQSLLALAAQPTWPVGRQWLQGAVDRATELRCRTAHVERQSRAADEAAFMASAHTVSARLTHGLAESDLERAELGNQIEHIEAVLAGIGEQS